MTRTLATVLCLIVFSIVGGSAAAVPVQADRILILKSARHLTLLHNGKPLRTYRVSLGSTPIGAKERQGVERLRKGCTGSIAATWIASFTVRFTSPIPTGLTAFVPAGCTQRPVARS